MQRQNNRLFENRLWAGLPGYVTALFIVKLVPKLLDETSDMQAFILANWNYIAPLIIASGYGANYVFNRIFEQRDPKNNVDEEQPAVVARNLPIGLHRR